MDGQASELLSLRNIDPETAQWLNEVEIYNRDDLANVGAVEAFRRVLNNHADQITVRLLFRLAGALSDTDWEDIPKMEQDELRAEAEV
jgi:DNA transformation protein and related proteins